MKIRFSILICVMLLAIFCSYGITQETGSGEVYEWPMIAGDGGWTGYSADPRVKPPFRLKWVSQPGSMGGTGNNLIVAGGRLFSRACCVDADTGDVLWKRSTGGTPTYYKGRLYTCKGGVTAIDAATGKRVWTKRGYRGPGRHWSAVTVTGGAVYVGSIKEHNGKQTYFANALDAGDGRELWSVPLIETVKLPRKSGYTPGVKMGAMAVKGGLAVATTHSPPAVFGLDRKTGKELWRQENVKAWIAPTNDGNMVLAPQAVQGVWAMDARTGKKLWHWGTEWTDGSRGASAETRANYAGLGTAKYPIISAYGMLFASNYGRRYTALDAKTGKKLWVAGDRKDVHSAWAGSCGPPTAAGGYVYTRGTVGKEYNGKRFRFVAAAVDKETGRPVWVRPVSGKSCARVAIAYGRIYVPTASDIYCFEPVPPDYKYEPQAPPEKPAEEPKPMAGDFGGKPGAAAAGGKPEGGTDWPMYGGCPERCGLEMKISLPIKEAWKFQTGGKVKSSPVISDNTVFSGSDSGKLFALDISTGKQKWSAEITPPEESKINVKWIRSAPAAADGIVVCGADDGVMRAFDAQTGKEKWEFKTAAQIRSSPAIVGNRVVFGSWDGHCYCLRLSDGAEFWRFRVGDPGVRVHVPLAVAAGRVYAGAIEDYAIPGLDLGTGRILEEYHDGTPPRGKKSPALGIVQGVAVYRGCLVTIGKGAVLDAVTGKHLGRIRSPGTGLPSLPAFSGETVYTSLSVQGTGIPDIISKTRSRKRPPRFRNTVINTPLVCGDIMVAATGRGTVEAYKLTDGKSSKPVWAWKSQSGKEISTAPAAGSGFIVVGSDDGHVYAFSYVKEKENASIRDKRTQETVSIVSQAGKAVAEKESRYASEAAPGLYTYKVANVYPHDKTAWTQGLVFDNGFVYEGTGRNGRSSLRKVKIETGEVLKEHKLDRKYFGEGITIYKDKIIQLTWRKKTGFVYDKKSFKLLKEFSYTTEGWGITHDSKCLIMSDGSATLRFLDPDTFRETGNIEVRDKNRPVPKLNELEYISDRIYANVYKTDRIAVIDPETGRVTGWIDLKGILKPEYRRGNRPNVLNGIAYNSKNNSLYVTGKLWPKLFKITLSQ